MARSGQLLLTLALLTSAAGLIFGLISLNDQSEINMPVKRALPAVPGESASEEQPALVEELAEPIPLSEFVEMTMRPLFSPSRRPLTATGDDAVPETQQEIANGPVGANQFLVMGIVIAADEKVALLKQQKSGNEVFRVKEGQKFSDWTVSEISPESVTIRQRGVTDVVKLSDNVLSTAQKQKLMQQARLEQAKTANKAKQVNRRTQMNMNRRTVRRYNRRNKLLPRTGNNNTPTRTVRTPVR
jgi:hypothetical protein